MAHWIYPLFVQKFGKTQKKFSLIPHRQKKPTEALLMVDRIEQRVKQTVRQGQLFSQVYDEIIKAIASEGYVYNKDCFVGVDFMNQGVKQDEYEFDEVLFAQPADAAVNYFSQIVEVYNPLFILNPFGEHDDGSFNTLHKNVTDRTMIGCSDHDNHPGHAVSVVVTRMHRKKPHIEEHQRILQAHKKGQKVIAVCHDSFGLEYVKSVIEEVKPDFIETRQPLKTLEEQE